MTTANIETEKSSLLFLHAQTPVHPGSGTALGVIDLPVQRERHTQWPTIPGSSLKGILRDACRRKAGGEENEDLWAAFGPETADAAKHAGALAVTDARILAFPVRSLRGVFAWATCPAVLERLKRDVRLAGCGEEMPIDSLSLDRNRCACAAGSPLIVEEDRLVLEEFDLQRTGDSGPAAEWIARQALGDQFTQSRFRSHLVVLDDDQFTHFVRHATEVVARIGLDYQKKTVKGGALFYQEFLPAETLFYSLVFANRSRREGNGKSAGQIMQYLGENTPSVLQIGGDETTGKGLCAVRFRPAT